MFPESFDLSAIVGDQTGDPNWGGSHTHNNNNNNNNDNNTAGFAAQLLTRGVTPRQGSKTDNAHPPIHPTKYTNSLQVCYPFSMLFNRVSLYI